MPLLEVLVIYLSAGAPFGVLVLFSQRSARRIAAFNAALATLGWPIFGTYRIYRGLFRNRNRQMRADPDSSPLEVLQRLSREVPHDAAEIFEIAGHSNPWLATNCYARARKKVIESHIERISRNSTGNPPSLLSNAAPVSPRIAMPVRELT